jgi:5-methylcytosine-specific restriction endonuclease McrA
MRRSRVVRLGRGECLRCGDPKRGACKRCTKEKRPYRDLIDTSKCSICGFAIMVHVHHRDGNHSNNDPGNLMALCPNHHAEAHIRSAT